MNHLDDLNPAQRRAVLHKDGPLLIVAGAGAGKTRVLAHRVLHLIKEGVLPEEILAVTFTNKAAKEMRERVAALLASDRDLNLPISREAQRTPFPFVSTFHSLGVHIIREQARLLNVKRHFTIFDRADSLRAVKDAMKQTLVDAEQFEPKKMLGIISREKGNGTACHEYERHAGNDFLKQTVLRVWKAYERILKENRSLDFDDLLLVAASLLEKNKEVRAYYSGTWKYLLIDEYQDTNRVQYRMSELIAGERKNICVVGDIDQNIYSWRGADIQNLLDFEKTYPHTTVILLEENYRSTKNIIGAANEIIAKNKNRIEKTLYTAQHPGEKITLFQAYNEDAEAYYIAKKMKSLVRGGVKYKDIALLYRTNFQSRVLEEVFLYEDIPYQVLGTRFFERKEVKDILSFLRASLNSESVADIKRVIDVPPRGIGKVTLMRMIEGKDNELTPALKARVVHFRSLLSRIRTYAESHKPSETVVFILKESGLEGVLKEGSDEDLERLQNVYELAVLARKYDTYAPEEGVEKLLEDAALATDQDSLEKENSTVKLMTVHASKGLEFDYVFISGLEEGLFPQESDNNRDGEEERRLFYVALTRARKKILLTCASVRSVFGATDTRLPSQFIGDIPEEYLEGDVEESGEREMLRVIE
ncbi:UvrD-helicase domain-containing protein [Candidatus Kaiserbacteria bacterium]|nr:UvrD-helicase domain-containing protein [Candidatus Kaiserbacteria bacterium]